MPRLRLEGKDMAEKLSPRETVTFEELLMSNTIERPWLIVGEERAISKAELLEEIKKLRDSRKKAGVG